MTPVAIVLAGLLVALGCQFGLNEIADVLNRWRNDEIARAKGKL